MRKTISVFIAVVILCLAFAGCGKSGSKPSQTEAPVTLEQLNTDPRFVARGFLEAVLSGDKSMYLKCYPDCLTEGEDTSLFDYFDAYKDLEVFNSDIKGTMCAGTLDVSMEKGFDEAIYRSQISSATGINYNDIGQMKIVQVNVLFANDEQSDNATVFYIVYEFDGSWYMYDIYQPEVET